jgi:hypothetical protein
MPVRKRARIRAKTRYFTGVSPQDERSFDTGQYGGDEPLSVQNLHFDHALEFRLEPPQERGKQLITQGFNVGSHK